MSKFRKKPVVIEAHQWFKNGDHPDDGEVMFPFGEDYEGKIVRYFRRPDVPGKSLCSECGKEFHVHGWIDTKEGGHRVCPSDWIITGIQGERYPCKADIFSATYDSVEADSPTPPAALAPTDDVTATPQHEAPFKGAAGATERYGVDEPAQPCCGQFGICRRPCTPRGERIADERWSKWGTIEVAIRNPSVAEFMRHWEARAIAAEAALASVKEENAQLRRIIDHGTPVSEYEKRLSEQLDEARAALKDAKRDGERLDWLDGVNAATNKRNGTTYGWRFNINHNRAALEDHSHPAISVREAIDAARAALAAQSEAGG